jgi:hypothetical protein
MALPRPSGLPVHIPKWAWKWLKWRTHKPAPKPKPPAPPTPKPPKPPGPKPNVSMYDDVSVNLIPVSAVAVAGYVDGHWPTYAQLVKKFPHAKYKISIAVFAGDSAQALDVEPGDATIAQAVGWLKKESAHGKHDVYTPLSWAEALVNELTKAGFVYGTNYRLWTAHYTGVPHLCNPKCGLGFTHIAHATQWTDKAGGKSLDESLCSAEFFA